MEKTKTEPESYKICPECEEEYTVNEKETTKKKVILRHNSKCPHCTHKKRR